MAETVKKSRIVSDDNLESSLLEEFDLRLKNCMQDDTKYSEELEEDEFELEEQQQQHQNGQSSQIYENLKVLNGNKSPTHQNGHRENGFHKTETITTNGDHQKGDCLENKDNATFQKMEQQQQEEDVNIYENIPNPIILTSSLEKASQQEAEIMQQDLEDSLEMKSVKDRMFLSTGDGGLLFTQTVMSPMLTPSDENYEFLQGVSQNTLTDEGSPKSDINDEKLLDDDDGFVGDAGFCGTEQSDKAGISGNEDLVHVIKSTLEKTIDILDPKCESAKFIEHEKYDILKPITKESQDADGIIYENVQNLQEVDEDADQVDEAIYENLRENIYENVQEVKNVDSSEPTSNEIVQTTILHEDTDELSSENVQDIVEEESTQDILHLQEEEYEVENKEIVEDMEEEEQIRKEAEGQIKVGEIVIEEPQQMETEDEIAASEERGMEEQNQEVLIVEERKESSFQRKDEQFAQDVRVFEEFKTNEFRKNIEEAESNKEKADKEDKGIYKSYMPKCLDIMKQINKFENAGARNEDSDSNVCKTNQSSFFSTESSSETTFVETTTESKTQDKVLKKKKSKKSKKEHEKENISVTETTNNDFNEEAHYNVSVKNLCRSFGDLTRIDEDKQFDRNNRPNYSRTKSMSDVRNDGKLIDNVFSGVSVKQLKSSFSKFDALQKKTVLHVRSADAGKAQEKFNGSAQGETTNCKSCSKPVFQMEQMKAERAIWHKNCFRCTECNKQLTVDTYESNEGTLYCKPHFKALFAPKAVEDDQPARPRKHELIIRESQPVELPPDVFRASDKPDLGLEELQSLNVKQRFQVFEQFESNDQSLERTPSAVNVKRSPSILSKLARFQAKGMDIGVADDALNGIPVEESSSEDSEVDGEIDGEDALLVRAKKQQREKPFHFDKMSDVKSKWEQGDQQSKEERREERKQEIQSIRSRLFMGKQGKMKEAYQQAVAESESGVKVKRSDSTEQKLDTQTKSLKERFEKGEVTDDSKCAKDKDDDLAVFESGISKKSRSIFLELDANASKAPQLSPISPQKPTGDIKKVYLERQQSENVVKSSDQVDDIIVETADISNRFKFFETYKEPEQKRKAFRITPPREGQVKEKTPDREIYRDPDIVRADEEIEDSEVAKQSHTATKMLSIFRQMEQNKTNESVAAGPKPLKRFTPPPEPARQETSSGDEESGSEDESDASDNMVDATKLQDEDLIEAQKAARAKQLRAKFEKWEVNEIQREQNNSSVNIAQEFGEDQSQIESAKSLRARFESMREPNSDKERAPRVKVNRFVDTTNNVETCKSCNGRVYPLEKTSVHGNVYHKNCFRCRECNTVLRMDSYSYNQGLFYCMPHFKRLFISKGNYETGFGLGQHKEKWNTTIG